MQHSKSTLVNLRKALPDPIPRNPLALMIGEETTVTVTLRNPLQVQIDP